MEMWPIVHHFGILLVSQLSPSDVVQVFISGSIYLLMFSSLLLVALLCFSVLCRLCCTKMNVWTCTCQSHDQRHNEELHRWYIVWSLCFHRLKFEQGLQKALYTTATRNILYIIIIYTPDTAADRFLWGLPWRPRSGVRCVMWGPGRGRVPIRWVDLSELSFIH